MNGHAERLLRANGDAMTAMVEAVTGTTPTERVERELGYAKVAYAEGRITLEQLEERIGELLGIPKLEPPAPRSFGPLVHAGVIAAGFVVGVVLWHRPDLRSRWVL